MRGRATIQVKQAAMRASQLCKTCGKHLFKIKGGCKCPLKRGRPKRGRPIKEPSGEELLRIIRAAMKEPGFWEE